MWLHPAMNSTGLRNGILLSLGMLWATGLRAEVIVDEAGRFSIDMPAPQNRATNATDSGLGKTTIHLLMHDADPSTAYILGYNDYPPGSIAKLDLAVTYKNVMEGVLGSMKSDLHNSGAHQLGDTKGWEYTFADKEGKLSGHVRSYFVGDRLYQIMFLGPPGKENSEESLHFLDSFRITR